MLYKKQKAQPLLRNDTPFLRALLAFSRHPKKAKQSREKALQTYNEKEPTCPQISLRDKSAFRIFSNASSVTLEGAFSVESTSPNHKPSKKSKRNYSADI